MIDSILTRSLSGPKPRIAIGIIPCETNCSNAKTRPHITLFRISLDQNRLRRYQYRYKHPADTIKDQIHPKGPRDSPISAKVQPNTANETAIIVILFLNSPFQATNAPPKRAPSDHSISLAVSFQTSLPKLLTTISGDKKARRSDQNKSYRIADQHYS